MVRNLTGAREARRLRKLVRVHGGDGKHTQLQQDGKREDKLLQHFQRLLFQLWG